MAVITRPKKDRELETAATTTSKINIAHAAGWKEGDI
jgi:hypothetical protein